MPKATTLYLQSKKAYQREAQDKNEAAAARFITSGQDYIAQSEAAENPYTKIALLKKAAADFTLTLAAVKQHPEQFLVRSVALLEVYRGILRAESEFRLYDQYTIAHNIQIMRSTLEHLPHPANDAKIACDLYKHRGLIQAHEGWLFINDGEIDRALDKFADSFYTYKLAYMLNEDPELLLELAGVQGHFSGALIRQAENSAAAGQIDFAIATYGQAIEQLRASIEIFDIEFHKKLAELPDNEHEIFRPVVNDVLSNNQQLRQDALSAMAKLKLFKPVSSNSRPNLTIDVSENENNDEQIRILSTRG
jgi:hypothetical protein